MTDEEHITSLKQATETLYANGMVVQFGRREGSV
jgi:hypothetical protein